MTPQRGFSSHQNSPQLAASLYCCHTAGWRRRRCRGKGLARTTSPPPWNLSQQLIRGNNIKTSDEGNDPQRCEPPWWDSLLLSLVAWLTKVVVKWHGVLMTSWASVRFPKNRKRWKLPEGVKKQTGWITNSKLLISFSANFSSEVWASGERMSNLKEWEGYSWRCLPAVNLGYIVPKYCMYSHYFGLGDDISFVFIQNTPLLLLTWWSVKPEGCRNVLNSPSNIFSGRLASQPLIHPHVLQLFQLYLSVLQLGLWPRLALVSNQILLLS